MQTFEAGKDVTFPIDITFQGQPAVPDQGTAVLSVYASDGTLLTTEDLTTGPTDLRVYVTVAAANNQISTSFSRRKLVIAAKRNGEPFTVTTGYRLLPAIEYIVTPADVRGFLGVNDGELPDEDVDLAKALLELEFETSQAIMSSALTSGEQSELQANEAIKYKAALHVIPSLLNRIAVQESDGNMSFSRNTRKDFTELKKTAESRLSYAMSIVSPQNNPGYSFLTTTADTDPFTGS